MKKRNTLCSIVCLLLFILVGCKTKEVAEDVNDSEIIESTKVKTTETIEKQEKNIWNNDKEEQLKVFMTTWGKEMKQEYSFYNENDELNWNNQIISKKNLEGKALFVVNNDEQRVNLFPKEEQDKEINVVAIASDEEDRNKNNHHLYFFSIQGDEAKVFLVSTDSTEEKIIMNETENETLKNNFNNIIFNNNNNQTNDKGSSLFDELSNEIKAVLLIEAIDSRLVDNFDEFNNPDGMYLNYRKQNEFWYMYFSSGRGVGHPLYLLTELPESYKINQELVRVSFDEYEEKSVTESMIDKSELYENYLGNPAKYKQAVLNFSTTDDSNLIEMYDNYCRLIGISNLTQKQESNNDSEVEQPSAEEIFGYYRDFIIDDLPDFSSDLKNHVAMKGVDEQGLPIIAHMIHGSEINITIEGSVINYSIYGVGGLDENGNVAKSHINDAYYDIATGSHGIY